ncbi:MAG: acyltransferase family protein, partial [Qipengyuania vulgaris]
ARRILPALAAVIAACFFAGWFFLLPDEMATLGKNSIAAIAFLSNVAFWWSANDYFAESVALQPLLHTWSLSVEEQFYLFFPILLWFLAKFSRSTLLVVIAALCGLSFAASIWATTHAPTANFYLIFFRIWELGFGSLLALTQTNLPRLRSAREVGSAAGAAMIIASILLIDETTPFPGLAALPACFGSTLLIWAGSAREGERLPLFNRILALKPLVGIGLISYSLYLWHWPILVAARIYFNSITIPIGAAIVCIALSVLLSWLSWRYVEQPFRGGRGRPELSRKQIFTWSAASMAALGAVSAAMLFTKGLPARLGDEVAAKYVADSSRSPREIECINRSPDDEPCHLGNQLREQVDYVLWGDSHAGSLIPGLERFVSERGLTAVTFSKSACAPLPGIVRLDKEGDHDCDGHNRAVLNRILEDYPDAEVLLAGRWALLAEGERYAGEEGSHPVISRVDRIEVARSTYPELVGEGLENAIEPLLAAGHRITVVKGIPEMGFDVPGTIARNAWLGWDMPSVSSAEFKIRQERANAVLDSGSVTFVDPANYLCTDTCAYVREGKALYRDDDHLSVYAARWLLPLLLDESGAGQAN